MTPAPGLWFNGGMSTARSDQDDSRVGAILASQKTWGVAVADADREALLVVAVRNQELAERLAGAFNRGIAARAGDQQAWAVEIPRVETAEELVAALEAWLNLDRD